MTIFELDINEKFLEKHFKLLAVEMKWKNSFTLLLRSIYRFEKCNSLLGFVEEASSSFLVISVVVVEVILDVKAYSQAISSIIYMFFTAMIYVLFFSYRFHLIFVYRPHDIVNSLFFALCTHQRKRKNVRTLICSI